MDVCILPPCQGPLGSAHFSPLKAPLSSPSASAVPRADAQPQHDNHSNLSSNPTEASVASDSAAGPRIEVLTAEEAAAAAPAFQPPNSLTELLAALRAAFDAEKADGHSICSMTQTPASKERLDAKVRALLSAYSAPGHAEDWRNFAFFNDAHYVRNLVEDCEDFELIVLCWKGGQGSRVHNHAASHCWLTVLQGTMAEALYAPVTPVRRSNSFTARSPDLPGVICAEAPCPPLVQVQHTQLKVGEVGYINDTLALHAVRCPGPEESVSGSCEDGVTLHLYAPPIKRVTLFEPDEGAAGRIVQRTPGFFTVRGKKH